MSSRLQTFSVYSIEASKHHMSQYLKFKPTTVFPKLRKYCDQWLTSGSLAALVYKEFDLSHDLVRKLLTVSTVRPYLQLQVRRGTGRTVGKEAHHYHFVTHFHVILNLEIKLGLRRKFHCLHHTNTTTLFQHHHTWQLLHLWQTGHLELWRRGGEEKDLSERRKGKEEYSLCDRHILSVWSL